ncbi:MAG TPA: thiosulfohydrolase SoxB, partial [Usitatibacter sp.]
MDRREFLQALAIASAAGLPLGSRKALAAEGDDFYDVPRFGNVSMLHMTDCHAQLRPVYFREPNVNLGIGSALGKAPHLVGKHFLAAYGIKDVTHDSHAFTYRDFAELAGIYGRMGGFAHIATLVKRLKAARPGALLLDGGDTWQGSATSLWTKGQDMIDAQKLLGVDIMTGHWEFTYGQERVKQVVENDFKGRIEFLAQNVATADFGDPVFKPYTIRDINGVPVGIIGQAFPYTPIANPRYFVPDWTFGIKEAELQKQVDDARAKGAKIVVLLSHNGMDVDL